jgi:hypothetical protein
VQLARFAAVLVRLMSPGSGQICRVRDTVRDTFSGVDTEPARSSPTTLRTCRRLDPEAVVRAAGGELMVEREDRGDLTPAGERDRRIEVDRVQ